MKSKFNKYLLSFCLILMCSAVFAQKDPPPPPGPPPPVGLPLPIDGGVTLLLVSGVAYGIYKLKRKK